MTFVNNSYCAKEKNQKDTKKSDKISVLSFGLSPQEVVVLIIIWIHQKKPTWILQVIINKSVQIFGSLIKSWMQLEIE